MGTAEEGDRMSVLTTIIQILLSIIICIVAFVLVVWFAMVLLGVMSHTWIWSMKQISKFLWHIKNGGV